MNKVIQINRIGGCNAVKVRNDVCGKSVIWMTNKAEEQNYSNTESRMMITKTPEIADQYMFNSGYAS